MRIKVLFLTLLIVLPLAIVAFLYLFGENQYEVKGNRLAGKALPHLPSSANASGQAEVIAFISGKPGSTTMAGRVSSRVARMKREGGKIAWLPFQDSGLANSLLCKDLGLPADTGGNGFWYLLLDSKGHLANVYDLRQERLLDTLAIEASILAGQAH